MAALTLDASVVLMAVPLRFAPRLAEVLAELEAGRGIRSDDEDGDVPEVVVVDAANGEWTFQMASTLAGNLPYKGVVALLDECADRSGEWVLKADIEVSEGISPIQLRNELVALSKLTNRLFGRGTWPIATKKELGSFHYRMDPGLAKWWREARAQSEGAR